MQTLLSTHLVATDASPLPLKSARNQSQLKAAPTVQGFQAQTRIRQVLTLFALVALMALLAGVAHAAESAAPTPIRVLVVTGGHGFDAAPFWQMFQDNPDIAVEKVKHPEAHARFKPQAAADYDVLVFYDMWQDISEEAQEDLVALLKSGKGIVALHHSLASYQQWPEYSRIIGGKYLLEPIGTNAVGGAASTYQHDVDFTVRVAHRNHPVTRGVDDFTVHDEVYGGFWVANDVIPLLTAEHPESSPVVGWARVQDASRIVYLQGGHDRAAYEDPNFRRLLANAIRWAAARE